MPRIVDIKAYDGFERKIQRLGLSVVLDQVNQLISGFEFRLAETRRGNGAAVLREMLDARFAAMPGWTIVKSGGIDWTSVSATMPQKSAWESNYRFPRGATS